MTQNSTSVTVPTDAAVLLWQTSTGVPPDPETTLEGNVTAQIFRAGSFNDPVPITLQNDDDTNSVFLGGPDVTTGPGATAGIELVAGAILQLTRVVGNDAMYAIAAVDDVSVNIMVGRQ